VVSVLRIIKKIVFTGGPNGGKTDAIPIIANFLEKLGWYVIIIREIATMFDNSNVGPSRVICSEETGLEFQRQLMKTQISIEEAYLVLLGALPESVNKVVFLIDRGLCDQIAYVGEEAFESLLKEFGIGSIMEAKIRYDAVAHMVTAAAGAPGSYVNKSVDKDSPRHESLEEAIDRDNLLKQAWHGHPNHAIIGCYDSFDEKIQKALMAVVGYLGEPEPLEIERKYLIKKPSRELLSSSEFKEYLIHQEYLETDDPDEDVEERIRFEVGDGGVHYSYTKKFGTGIKRVEIPADLTAGEYRKLKKRSDSNAQPIIKTRYRALYNDQIIEIDIYPNWDDHAIMEIVLRGEDDLVIIPDFVTVIKEVTGDKTFSNHCLAYHPLEL